jgi:hypothetical protein
LTQENPEIARALLDALAGDPALQHELMFYSTFAHKTFLLMQRKGPSAEGYDRLQQSFRDAVKQVHATIAKAREHGYAEAEELLEISPAGMAKLMDIMGDLALIKQSTQ